MNVQELITELEKIEDKTLDIRVETDMMVEQGMFDNEWVYRIDEHPTGSSGYEEFGEVVLWGRE